MTKISLVVVQPFPKKKIKSHGTFDDFYDDNKYKSMDEAWDARDFVIANYAADEDWDGKGFVIPNYTGKPSGTLYITAFHVKRPEVRLTYRLVIQYCYRGIDTRDDTNAHAMANELLAPPIVD